MLKLYIISFHKFLITIITNRYTIFWRIFWSKVIVKLLDGLFIRPFFIEYAFANITSKLIWSYCLLFHVRYSLITLCLSSVGKCFHWLRYSGSIPFATFVLLMILHPQHLQMG